MQVALATRISLREIQTWWTDEDLATVLQELDERAEAIEEAQKGR